VTPTPVGALDMVGVGSLKREEVILHLVDDAIRDLALIAPTPTAQEHRSVVCLTCPDQRLILHAKQLDAPFVVAFYKGPGKDVVRIFPFRYDDDRQFLFHDLRRNKRMKIALHRLYENRRAGERGGGRFALGDGLGECEGEKRQDSKQTLPHGESFPRGRYCFEE
jgi:hypothetical protein